MPFFGGGGGGDLSGGGGGDGDRSGGGGGDRMGGGGGELTGGGGDETGACTGVDKSAGARVHVVRKFVCLCCPAASKLRQLSYGSGQRDKEVHSMEPRAKVCRHGSQTEAQVDC